MYYIIYDPWIGKLLYLKGIDNLPYRGDNIQKLIFKKYQMWLQFLVAIWNKPSTECYTRCGGSDEMAAKE
uniref:Uncharacterized protein n=1 Tax=Strigops habroptila TaxID=2489341 RepID=A0A672U5S9_STRHB